MSTRWHPELIMATRDVHAAQLNKMVVKITKMGLFFHLVLCLTVEDHNILGMGLICRYCGSK